MPSRAERIILYTSQPDEPRQIIDFPLWWDRNAFFNKFGNRKKDTNNPFYVDYNYKLSSEEAMDWDKKCCHKAYPNPDHINLVIRVKMIKFRAAIENAEWVVIESYEWESGMS